MCRTFTKQTRNAKREIIDQQASEFRIVFRKTESEVTYDKLKSLAGFIYTQVYGAIVRVVHSRYISDLQRELESDEVLCIFSEQTPNNAKREIISQLESECIQLSEHLDEYCIMNIMLRPIIIISVIRVIGVHVVYRIGSLFCHKF